MKTAQIRGHNTDFLIQVSEIGTTDPDFNELIVKI